jgi:flagellar basal-body rod protein FlgF
MENALFVGLSRQMALGREMDVIANNLANSNTGGFKAEEVVFHPDYTPDRGSAIKHAKPIAFVADYGLTRNLQEGEFTPTGNPLDVAISGQGYLAVQTPDGDRYTRNGHLGTDSSGQLVTSDGNPVLDDAGKPIVLKATDGAPTIAGDGTISAKSGRIAKLKIVDFPDENGLQRQGGTLLATDQTPVPAGKAKVVQGMLESSNVQSVVQMTRMIDVLRAYQANANLMQANDELIRRAIDHIGNARA